MCMLSTLKKKKLGTDTYNQEVVSTSPTGRVLAKMAEKDNQAPIVRFNTVHYLAKNERLYSEFGDLLNAS